MTIVDIAHGDANLGNGVPQHGKPFPMRVFPIPRPWNAGSTDTGPIPYQSQFRPEVVTGERAACPTTLLSTSVTRK